MSLCSLLALLSLGFGNPDLPPPKEPDPIVLTTQQIAQREAGEEKPRNFFINTTEQDASSSVVVADLLPEKKEDLWLIAGNDVRRSKSESGSETLTDFNFGLVYQTEKTSVGTRFNLDSQVDDTYLGSVGLEWLFPAGFVGETNVSLFGDISSIALETDEGRARATDYGIGVAISRGMKNFILSYSSRGELNTDSLKVGYLLPVGKSFLGALIMDFEEGKKAKFRGVLGKPGNNVKIDYDAETGVFGASGTLNFRNDFSFTYPTGNHFVYQILGVKGSVSDSEREVAFPSSFFITHSGEIGDALRFWISHDSRRDNEWSLRIHNSMSLRGGLISTQLLDLQNGEATYGIGLGTDFKRIRAIPQVRYGRGGYSMAIDFSARF